MRRIIAALALCAVGCSGKSSTGPTATTTTTATKIIAVTGDLAFGNVNIGESAARTFTIGNSGNAALTFTSFSATGGTGTVGYSASPTSGTVAAGGTLTVTMRFSPTAAGFFSHVLTVVGDQTGGGAAINVSGTGVNNTPLFTKTGTGASVFDMPTSVTRVRIFGDYSGSCENFIIHIGGRGVVNEILGSCSIASGRHYEGTFVTTGGVVEVLNSTGISWSFVEVR